MIFVEHRRELYCRGCRCRRPHLARRLRMAPDDPFAYVGPYYLLHNVLVGWTCSVCCRWSFRGRSR